VGNPKEKTTCGHCLSGMVKSKKIVKEIGTEMQSTEPRYAYGMCGRTEGTAV